MIIGKTRCNLCFREKELTKKEMIDLIEDCTTQQRLISLITGFMTEKDDIIIPVMCPECNERFDIKRQDD